MSKLYFEGEVSKAFEAAKKAGEYAVKGQFADIHCVDAALEAAGQIHALTRVHEDAPQPVGACPDDPCIVGERILEICEQPRTYSVDATGVQMDPATIALLLQLLPLVIDLFKRWRS